MIYGVYEVRQGHTYRNHKAGERFEVQLGRRAEERFVRRGVIQLVGTVEPKLVPGSYIFPNGWLSTEGKE